MFEFTCNKCGARIESETNDVPVTCLSCIDTELVERDEQKAAPIIIDMPIQ